MVCQRCILVVQQELNALKIAYHKVTLGEIYLIEKLNENAYKALQQKLLHLGFEILDDKKSKLIERIKSILIEQVQNLEIDKNQNLSQLLSHKLHHDYTYLSNLFSEIEGITIEKYFIHQRVEKVKELIVYDEWNLSQIAYKMGYSSVAYLSNQFKKITGFSPSYFKQLKDKKRNPIDKV